MKTPESEFKEFPRTLTSRANSAREMGHPLRIVTFLILISCFALAQDKSGAKSDVSGHYEGTAKGKTEEVIDVSWDLTEKDGVMSGMIHSTHGDFQITSGSHKGET